MKKKLPRAALLGTVAGIGFIWMATQGVFDVFGDPLIGLPILFVAMVGIFGGYLLLRLWVESFMHSAWEEQL